MRIDDKLKILCANSDLTLSEIGRRLGKSPQSFSQKVKRGSFTLDDLQEIAMVTNSSIECNIVLQNGEKIKII